MRMILYRVLVTDRAVFSSTAGSLPNVQNAMSKKRGQIVECDDAITEAQLAALDAAVRSCASSLVDGPGPGRARGIPPQDDRTAMVFP